MVKGSTRHVVVIKSPDEKMFEQAIFLLREDAVPHEGVSDSDLLRQAREVCKREDERVSGSFERLFWFACGAASVLLMWILFAVL